MAWHFVTRCVAVKLVKHWMSSHFSKSRDLSYIGLVMWPKCPRKDWQGKSCWLHQWEGSEKVMLAAGRVTTSLTLLGRSRTIWYCCWPWGISNPSCPCDPVEKKSGHENELAKHAANLVITFTSIGQPIIIGCSSTFFLTTITVW